MTCCSCERPYRIVGGVVVALAVMLGQLGPMARVVQASLNLVMPLYPDIHTSFIQMHYDHNSFLFKAEGIADQLNDGTVYWIDNTIDDYNFVLTATIDNAGNLLPGGTLSIKGNVVGKGFTSGTLLTGNLTAFGYGPPGTPFEFLFQPTGGDAYPLYAPGAPDGIVYHSNSTDYHGDFLTNFHNGEDDGGSADTGINPEPASAVIWCFLGALAVAAGLRTRRGRRGVGAETASA